MRNITLRRYRELYRKHGRHWYAVIVARRGYKQKQEAVFAVKDYGPVGANEACFAKATEHCLITAGEPEVRVALVEVVLKPKTGMHVINRWSY